MLSRGSEWRRWEPHIHAPGTVMNNQFRGPTAWGDYLTALERATPVIEAIANVTRTGKVGDGRIFVSGLAQAIRIRTGETGVAAA